jgi:hypothetical protein
MRTMPTLLNGIFIGNGNNILSVVGNAIGVGIGSIVALLGL